MNQCYLLLVFGFLYPIGTSAGAAPELTSPTQYLMQRWTAADGLPESEVMGAAQTPDGFLWCVTRNHLVRFDGRKFETVADERSLQALRPLGIFLGVAVDARGRLWVLAEKGAGCWNNGRWRIYQTGRQYIALVRSEGGRNWFLNIGGLVLIENDAARAIPFDPSIPPENNILAYSASWHPGDPSLWLGRFSGLYRFVDGQYRSVANPLPDETQGKVVHAGPKRLWVGCGETVVWRETAANWNFLPALSQPRGDEIRHLHESRDGTLWAGTRRAVLCWQGSRWVAMAREDSGFPLEIRGILEDRDGNLWMGCGGGLLCFKKRVVRVLGDAAIQCAWERPDGEVWIASAQNIVTTSPGRRPLQGLGLPANIHVTAMLRDRAGCLWIGTQGDGLYRIEASQSTLIAPGIRCPIPARNISALSEDSQGRLLVGVWNGLLRYDPRSGDLGLAGGNRVNRKITMLWKDSGGAVWAGLQSHGLMRINADQTTQSWIWPSDGIPGSEIYDMLRDARGTLWIAGNGGLARWGTDGSRFLLTAEHGLADSVVRQVAGDRQGSLWLGTRLGIQRIPLADLDAAAAGRRRKVGGFVLGRDAGIAEPSCLGGFRSDLSQDGREVLWFPTAAGLVKIEPARLIGARPPASRIYVESIWTRSGPLHELCGLLPNTGERAAGPVELSVRTRPIEIRFAAAAPGRTEAPRFTYRMTGLEEEWSPIGTSPLASYPALPAGRYRFEVKIPPECGGTSQTLADLNLIVQPVFWQSGWFYGLVLLGTSGLAAVLARGVLRRRYRRRVRELKREQALQQERARIARDMHDEIGAGLTGLAMTSDMAKARCASLEEAADQFGRIFHQARSLTHALDEIVWAVNPVNDTLEQMVSYLFGITCEALDPAAIRYRLAAPDPLPAMAISSRVRHQVCLVVREALANIVKHSRAREVTLRMELAGGDFILLLADDGRGFDPERLDDLPPGHDGLKNMRTRIEEIGGRLELHSVPGQGVRLRLSVILTTAVTETDDVRMRYKGVNDDDRRGHSGR